MAKWRELKLTVEPNDIELISQLFIDYGSNGVSITDRNDALPHPELDEMWSVSLDNYPENGAIITAYLPIDENLDETETSIEAEIEQLHQEGLIQEKYNLETHTVDDNDWLHEWEKYYHPIHLTDNLEIIPIWEKEETSLQDDDVVRVYLDPGLAFGTGSHPTTQLCAQILSDDLENGNKVYDVGTGSGILAIIAAKLGAKEIGAYDFDIQAVDSAKYNASLNEVETVIHFEQKDLLNGVTEPVNVIVANILEPIIIRLIPMIPDLLLKDGTFIISGILEEQISNIETYLKSNQLEIKEIRKNGDWAALVVKKQNKGE